MKKVKWFSFPITCLFLMLVLIIATPSAKADANLMENGSALYAWIKEPNELRTYIDQDGLYSSTDVLQEHDYSNAYKIIVDEPGQLVFAPLFSSYASYAELYLYSDFGLASQLAEIPCINNSQESLGVCSVNAGTYYYRLSSSYTTGKATVFIGFIPNSGKIKQEWSYINKPTDYEIINPIPISSADELSSYIDHDGKPNSQIDQIEQQFSETYQFTITNPGTLVISSISNATYTTEFYLYSNNELSSRLIECDCIRSSKDGMIVVELDPGTYYYNTYNRFNSGNTYVYLGFITDASERVDRYTSTLNHNEETVIDPIKSIEDLQQKILNGEYTYVDQISKGSAAAKRKIVLDETSLLYVFSVCDEYNVKLKLCSDSELISCIDSRDVIRQDKDKNMIYTYLLDPGEYYLVSSSAYSNAHSYVYLGYIPVSDVIFVESIQLTDDKTAAVVKFGIADEYNPDQYKAQVRIEKGIVRTRSINNKNIWKLDTRENAIESHEFIATENGIYTARIAGNDLQPYLFTFEVTGIENTQEKEKLTNSEISGNAINQTALVNERLNFWAHPNKNADRLSTLDVGTRVYVYQSGMNEKAEEWSYIRIGDQTGYVMTKSLTFYDNEAHPQPDQQPEAPEEPDHPVQEAIAESEPAEQSVMTASDMRKYIRMLEDQIEDLGLELPEFAADTTQEAYLKALEQVLRDNGYDF